MIHLGLIGYPLSHSLSPIIHAAALQSCGLQGDYSIFPNAPHDMDALNSLLARVRMKEIQGLNVTIPHKQTVIQFLDELTPTAKSIGAVNTIYFHDNKLIGDNTDAPGFLWDVKKFLTTETPHVQLKTLKETCGESRSHGEFNVLVLGAGGSARAIVYALLTDSWDVTIAARRIEQANNLAKQFEKVRVIEYSVQTFKLTNVQLIINTTPVGMAPNTDESPWPQNLRFPSHTAIYDLIYNPRETKLVRDARLQGLQATTGLGMLIEQAALSFEIWTGHNPSREMMRACVDQSPMPNYQSLITDHGAV